MALIICKNCGKKVSDTRDTCIHCGASLLAEEPVSPSSAPEKNVEETTTSVKASDNLVNFKSLGEAQQEELVHAFWEEDPIAKRFQTKKLILRKISEFGLCLILPMFLVIILGTILKLKVQNMDTFFGVLSALLIIIAVLILKALTLFIIQKKTVKSKIKRYTYEKRFQTWARETRQIAYYPVFIKEIDEQMYEQIDIDTFTL